MEFPRVRYKIALVLVKVNFNRISITLLCNFAAVGFEWLFIVDIFIQISQSLQGLVILTLDNARFVQEALANGL